MSSLHLHSAGAEGVLCMGGCNSDLYLRHNIQPAGRYKRLPGRPNSRAGNCHQAVDAVGKGVCMLQPF